MFNLVYLSKINLECPRFNQYMGGMQNLDRKINEASVLFFKSSQPGPGIQKNSATVLRRFRKEESYWFFFFFKLLWRNVNCSLNGCYQEVGCLTKENNPAKERPFVTAQKELVIL